MTTKIYYPLWNTRIKTYILSTARMFLYSTHPYKTLPSQCIHHRHPRYCKGRWHSGQYMWGSHLRSMHHGLNSKMVIGQIRRDAIIFCKWICDSDIIILTGKAFIPPSVAIVGASEVANRATGPFGRYTIAIAHDSFVIAVVGRGRVVASSSMRFIKIMQHTEIVSHFMC